MAFKCLAHANTILICLVLSWKGVKKRDPHPFGRQLLGHSEQWGLRDTPEGDAGQSSSVASTATCLFAEGPRKKERSLQYSCLENSMDRGVWRATVHGVPKESDMTEHISPPPLCTRKRRVNKLLEILINGEGCFSSPKQPDSCLSVLHLVTSIIGLPLTPHLSFVLS